MESKRGVARLEEVLEHTATNTVLLVVMSMYYVCKLIVIMTVIDRMMTRFV